MTVPVPVGPSRWQFPDPSTADEHGLVAVGGDLEPSTLIAAYRSGLFPMPLDDREELIGWWSPHERGVLEFEQLRVSRSLRKSCRRYEVSINMDFGSVISACAATERPGGWISPAFVDAYSRLHDLGWAHSVETWRDGELVGGLYGVQIKGLFAGESMFHRARDGSKVALVALVAGLETLGATFIDVQWATPHLTTLGVQAVTQQRYFSRLEDALASEAASLGAERDPHWVAKSPRYLDRTVGRPIGTLP